VEDASRDAERTQMGEKDVKTTWETESPGQTRYSGGGARLQVVKEVGRQTFYGGKDLKNRKYYRVRTKNVNEDSRVGRQRSPPDREEETEKKQSP